MPVPPVRSAAARRRGFTLIEAVISLSLVGVVFAAVASQFVESARLSSRITHTLEHAHNARETLDRLSADIRAAQILILYPEFNDRSSEARDGQSGNYLVLHSVNEHGTITRTVGYYIVPLGGSQGWALYRHDSDLGDSTPGSLPNAASAQQHRRIKRAVRLPDSNRLFRCVRDRGVSIFGEFGTGGGHTPDRTEFIRCTISTRS